MLAISRSLVPYDENLSDDDEFEECSSTKVQRNMPTPIEVKTVFSQNGAPPNAFSIKMNKILPDLFKFTNEQRVLKMPQLESVVHSPTKIHISKSPKISAKRSNPFRLPDFLLDETKRNKYE